MFKYDKDKIKNNLTLNQISELLAELGGEPQTFDNYIIAATICHNYPGEGSHKLYYYDNTKLFKCYTDCSDTFDIYELVCKIKNLNREFKPYYTKEGQLSSREWQLFDAVEFVAIFFNIEEDQINEDKKLSADWDLFHKYEKANSEIESKRVELKIYDDSILKFLPQPRILNWENEGIAREVMLDRGIAFDPRNQGIVIPHYNIDNKLIGIRERTIVKENEKYGKYRPAILNGQMYNHPLGFNLYNLNNSKENIKVFKKVIIFEGEKSPLKYSSYFGKENDITVAGCGSSLTSYQVSLLLSLGIEEIIIAFDKQFKEKGDKEYKRWTEKLINIHNKFSSYIKISFMFDKWDLLDYKDSPIDKEEIIFLKLFERRIYL